MEEDLTHEFKGHRMIHHEENVIKSSHFDKRGKYKPTRQYIAKYICGMLNTGKGGTIHCGIIDSGKVLGIVLSRLQRQHVKLAINDALSCFRPSVPKHRYSITFVPVWMRKEFDYSKRPKEPWATNKLSHLLRTPEMCWCDMNTAALMQRGELPPVYVTEIAITPWDPTDPRNYPFILHKKYPTLHPFYQTENGKCYIRLNASNQPITLEDVANMTREEVAIARFRASPPGAQNLVHQ